MQGIFLGNHVRAGVDDGGFDAITIERNRIEVNVPNGIYVGSGRGVRIISNQVYTVAGAMLRNGAGPAVKATIKAVESQRVVACGNLVAAQPQGFGTGACPAGVAAAPL